MQAEEFTARPSAAVDTPEHLRYLHGSNFGSCFVDVCARRPPLDPTDERAMALHLPNSPAAMKGAHSRVF